MQKKLICYLFLVLSGLAFRLSSHEGKPEPQAIDLSEIELDDESEIDSTFLLEYSEILGVDLDTSCNPDLVATVASWLGTPYRHAGFSRKGVDCSGFVAHIYQEVFDISLTHSSSSMISQMKTLVGKEELQQGDILFFKIHGKRISHVGLYLGDNKFVHASIYRGIVVDDLRDAYYTKHYFKAGRPL